MDRPLRLLPVIAFVALAPALPAAASTPEGDVVGAPVPALALDTVVSSEGHAVALPHTDRGGRSGVAEARAPVGGRLLLAAAPATGAAAGGRERVASTTTFPNRAIVLLTGGGQPPCSGVLVSPDTVLTAGRCVHGGPGGTWRSLADLRAQPGFDPARADPRPFGSCGVRSLHTVVGWTVFGDDRHDYGAVKLSCRIGEVTGYLGWWWEASSLDGKQATVTGYPAGDGGGMWTGRDRVHGSEPERIHHPAGGGGAGAPVLLRRGTTARRCAEWCVIGIDPGDGPAPRVTRAVSDALFHWTALES